jgi:hypothetical protein
VSELSQALGGAAPKHRIECNGKVDPVGLVTQGVKVAYERALYEKARAALAGVRRDVDKDYYERRMDALVEKYQDGSFAMESEFGRKALQKPGGSILLLSLLMGTTGPDGVTPLPELEVITLVSQKPEEVGAVFKTVIAESFPGVDVEKIAADLEAAPGPKA